MWLRWSAIDFENKTITINHTISMPRIDGKTLLIPEDNAKNKSSLRTLPLAKAIEDKLLEQKAQQEEYQKFFRRAYNKEWREYICVMPDGRLITPNYITSSFPKFLESHGLKRIRFHDLRHTRASLLLNKGKQNGITLKDIQVWLGHSDFSTTANTYSHLDATSKVSSLNTLSEAVSLQSTVGTE